ncbi:MAG: hypothetical protein A2358_03350 [Candidatus Staskawiczbacteria bacterium RIFOXYB1_FULL_37_44]|uniref:GH26 domain-containing protein n=1 Tax=Candidatus Staskawiczbacteria bacterium RIFOXYB1_FULL_37_44 TaxID=1802223 RepID=A0A1G2IUC5_9BACT|nr:MAG: hypothetical protein A2358_03350 [Candidatus Staskawiczbacteria bacterium RIFOXYB1_FULL_37_44]OGZ83043.1 MAG: hypothetical protein A2416_01255 [Candidatus Staskawiczbacteria bacterium RIFOXYC1_FULL_37_52]OGZ90143.1 MAG: hypothetical protein A2581_01885 [Candidatus Staskawiczbacteria bacterium RIFOXYD1_FULL_37_110]
MQKKYVLALGGLVFVAVASIALIILKPSPVEIKYQKLWGAYTGNTPQSFADFQKIVGKKANMNAVFVGWNDFFPFDLGNPLKANGQTLVVFWEQNNVALDNIIAGNSDEYIKQFALDAKQYGGQVILIPLHEMNGNWNPWNGTAENNTPEKVIGTFRHIHNLFFDNGNVKFAFVVNNESAPNTPDNAISKYYPGDNYVDYVGVDGFNFGDPWQSYSEIFLTALEQLKKYKKPIYIFSMATTEGPKKSGWIKDALLKMQTDKSIAGFIWFNENKEKNWPLNSDPESLQAFKAGIK